MQTMTVVNCIISLSFLACVSAQFLFASTGGIGGFLQGYHFEYHKTHRLLMVKDNLNCYLIFTNDDLEAAIQKGTHTDTDRIKAEVVAQIQAGVGLTDATTGDIKYDFQDYLASAQCRLQTVHKLEYTFVPATTVLPPDITSVVTYIDTLPTTEGQTSEVSQTTPTTSSSL